MKKQLTNQLTSKQKFLIFEDIIGSLSIHDFIKFYDKYHTILNTNSEEANCFFKTRILDGKHIEITNFSEYGRTSKYGYSFGYSEIFCPESAAVYYVRNDVSEKHTSAACGCGALLPHLD